MKAKKKQGEPLKVSEPGCHMIKLIILLIIITLRKWIKQIAREGSREKSQESFIERFFFLVVTSEMPEPETRK